MKTRKQISIANNNLEIIELPNTKQYLLTIFEDLKELAQCDNMDCVEKDQIMVSRIDEIINELNNNCDHNNTITNECSDCNDDELYDLLLKPVLNSIINTYIGGANNNLTDLIYDIHEGEADLTDELVEKIEADILKRLSL